MDGWNTTFLLGRHIFRGYVSFREGKTYKDDDYHDDGHDHVGHDHDDDLMIMKLAGLNANTFNESKYIHICTYLQHVKFYDRSCFLTLSSVAVH